MKTILLQICFTLLASSLLAQNIKLNPPDTDRGLPVMKALELRASAKEFDSKPLILQDLSDLLWAAIGINRPESGKRTAPSAINAQDIDVYVVMKKGIYLYNAQKHILEFVTEGDHRKLVAEKQKKFTNASLFCVMVSDVSRFRFGDDEQKKIWSAENGAIVSQNISIFCASVGFSSRPRAYMDKEGLREVLKLKDSQTLILNNPVSYIKKGKSEE